MNNLPKEDNQDTEIDLIHLFRGLLRRWWIILLCAVIGGAAAFLYSRYCITPQYLSTTSVYILNRKDTAQVTTADFQVANDLTNDYNELIKSRRVLETVIKDLSLDISTSALSDSITVSTTKDTRILSISVQNANPDNAKAIADKVREVASQQIVDIMQIDAVNLVDEASLPTVPVSPNTKKNGMLGVLVGMVLACGVIVVIELTNDTICTSEDVQNYLGLSVLGTIPNGQQKPGKKGYGSYGYGYGYGASAEVSKR